MKATFHISKVMKESNGTIRKVGSMERIMPVALTIEMIQKKLGEFYVKNKEGILETVMIEKTQIGTKLKTYLNNKPTNTLETIPTYK